MKTAAIILFIVYVVSKLIYKGLENYIRNDNMEAMRYYFSQGTNTTGIIYSVFRTISALAFSTDVILIFTMLINKI